MPDLPIYDRPLYDFHYSMRAVMTGTPDKGFLKILFRILGVL